MRLTTVDGEQRAAQDRHQHRDAQQDQRIRMRDESRSRSALSAPLELKLEPVKSARRRADSGGAERRRCEGGRRERIVSRPSSAMKASAARRTCVQSTESREAVPVSVVRRMAVFQRVEALQQQVARSAYPGRRPASRRRC